MLHHAYSVCKTHIERGRTMTGEGHMERVTVTLTHAQVLALRGLAAKNKVAVAWVVRYAVERLLEEGPAVQLTLDLPKAS